MQENFSWPEFRNDKERIKAYSKLYKEHSIVEAFESVYGQKINVRNVEVNETPVVLSVGDIISVSIKSVTKGAISFENTNLKDDILCRINLHRYEKFKNLDGSIRVNVKVTERDQKRIVVDPLGPLFDEWIKPIISNKTYQYQVDEENIHPVTVRNLKLGNGGFIGKVKVPTISEFLGEDYFVEAFIPGSHIVQNIEKEFESWEGRSVQAFVTNYIPKPGSATEMSVVCSRKNYITHLGNLAKIDIYDSYCTGENWKNITSVPYRGIITGVINTSRKTGIFVEVPELMITGMVNAPATELVNYKPGQNVQVNIQGFDDLTYFDNISGQRLHIIPYTIENGELRECNLKVLFKFI